MAGPPAGMTPPLATVLREGRATGNALRTVLVQLAGTGYIRVPESRSRNEGEA